MFTHWLGNNRNDLKKRFPKFENFLVGKGFFDYSTATFAVGTAHEFIWVFFISFYAVVEKAYQWWFAIFSVFFIHIVIHILQWAIYRKYIPVILSSILTLPYCIYAYVEFEKASILSPVQMFLWAVIGLGLTIFSLLFAFSFMRKFQEWQDKH